MAKNYTERVVHTVCRRENKRILSKNYNVNPSLSARVSRGEQGESQRRGDGMHSTRTSTALFNRTEGVTANNHFDRFFENIVV